MANAIKISIFFQRLTDCPGCNIKFSHAILNVGQQNDERKTFLSEVSLNGCGKLAVSKGEKWPAQHLFMNKLAPTVVISE